jgi:phage portal protein BeeE
MTLLPWIKKIESAFQRSIFGGSSSFLELDLSGLTRGDPAQRWASYAIAVQNRILTANEIRSIEGWNARPGGDEFAPIPGAPETGAAAATGGTDPGDAAGADAGGA